MFCFSPAKELFPTYSLLIFKFDQLKIQFITNRFDWIEPLFLKNMKGNECSCIFKSGCYFFVRNLKHNIVFFLRKNLSKYNYLNIYNLLTASEMKSKFLFGLVLLITTD